jgi:hypothetical protein
MEILIIDQIGLGLGKLMVLHNCQVLKSYIQNFRDVNHFLPLYPDSSRPINVTEHSKFKWSVCNILKLEQFQTNNLLLNSSECDTHMRI